MLGNGGYLLEGECLSLIDIASLVSKPDSLQDKIAFVMKSHQDYLQASIIGHHFLRKLNLRLFQRDRQAWKTQLQNETATAQRAEVKKRQRQEDEVDLIFKKIKG